MAPRFSRTLGKSSFRRGYLPVAVVAAVALLVPLAIAVTAYACNSNLQDGNYSVPAHTWLQLTVNRRYNDNNAWKSGWADCQKMIAPNSSPELKYTYTCSSSGFAYGFSDDLGRAPYPNCNTYMAALMLNNTGSKGIFDFYQHY